MVQFSVKLVIAVVVEPKISSALVEVDAIVCERFAVLITCKLRKYDAYNIADVND